MTASGVQGRLLEINVLGCKNLRDKEWLSRQDPYVVILYGTTRFRTKTDTDGGRNPSFNQKFVIPLIEGLREVNVEVWNSNTLTFDDFIGSGRILLEKALTAGYDDSTWNLTSKRGKFAGELRVILHFTKTDKQKPVAPVNPMPQFAPYNPPPPQAYPYAPPPAAPYNAYPSPSGYYNPQERGEYPPPYPGSYSGAGPTAPQSYNPAPWYPPQPSFDPTSYTPSYTSQSPYSPAAPPAFTPAYTPTSAGYPPVYREYPYRPT